MIRPDLISNSIRGNELATATLRVDIIADLICPWCYLGKRRLDAALRAVQGPSVLRWLPYQLNPAMPDSGMGFEEYLESRFGSRAAVQPGLDKLTAQGLDDGIRFRFDLIKRVPNTLAAHRLLSHAGTESAGVANVAEELFRGFFEEGLDIGRDDVLIDVGTRHGLTRSNIAHCLQDDALRLHLQEQAAEMRRGGVSGVPDFVINDRVFVIGAQPAPVLVDAFDRAMFGERSDQPVSDILH